jgi:AcrR family transcriptional regulator
MSVLPSEPRRRGPAPSLQPADVVAEALRLLDQHGESGFSMRSLGEALGVSPMTIYTYVATKSRLVEMVIDSVIDGIAPPDPEATNWRDELRRYALEAWDAQVPHPWIPAYLASRHIVERPAQQRSRSALMRLFERAGADDAGAREGVAVFFSFMIGSFLQAAPAVADHGPTERSRSLFEKALDIVVAGLRHRFESSD